MRKDKFGKTVILAAGIATSSNSSYQAAVTQIKCVIQNTVKNTWKQIICPDKKYFLRNTAEYNVLNQFADFEVWDAFMGRFQSGQAEWRPETVSESMERALERAAAQNVRCLIVQPLHLTAGREYAKLAALVKKYSGKIDRILMGAPLLSDESDYAAVVRAVAERTAAYCDGQTAVCLTGHGTITDAGSPYEKLQQKFAEEGYTDYYIGTVSGMPSMEETVHALAVKGGYQRVVLAPLMVAAGRHVMRDIAGDGEKSWKSTLLRAGYGVHCISEGLGQMPQIQEIYASHVLDAVKQLFVTKVQT